MVSGGKGPSRKKSAARRKATADIYGMLEALADAKHEEHDSYLEWLGGEYDPEAFDLDKVNQLLALVDLTVQPCEGRDTKLVSPRAAADDCSHPDFEEGNNDHACGST